MRGQGFKNPPVQVGEEIDVRIEAVGEKGDGIAKKDGFVLFVPGVKEGDEVRVKVTKVLRNVGFAESVGAAQGSPKSSKKAPAEEESEESSEEESYEAPSVGSSEDSEDFGEETEEVEETEEDKEE
ncbi:MAG: TRAM domain-containing protein [Nanoarchaeota archaeon]